MTTSETTATTSGWALISLPTILVCTLLLTIISVLAVTSLKQRLSSTGFKLPSLISIASGHAPKSAVDPSTESQASVEQLTLEQLMNQAMKQMTQVMTSTVGDDANSGASATASVDTQHQRQHTKQQQLLMTKINKTLPPNWEVGVTVHGRIYYIDHLNQQTTWDHPLLHDVADWRQFMRQGQLHWDSLLQYIASLPQPDSQPPDHVSSQTPPAPEPATIDASEKNADIDELPLPPFWEKATTKEGIPYYVNHLTRRTSWVDPRTSKPSVQSTQSVYLLKKYREEVWAELKKQAASSHPALHTVALTTSDSDSNLMAGMSQMTHQVSEGSLASSTVSTLMPLGGAPNLKSSGASSSVPRATRTSSFSSVVLTSPQSDATGAKPRRFSAFATLQQQFSQTITMEPLGGLFVNNPHDAGSRAMNNV